MNKISPESLVTIQCVSAIMDNALRLLARLPVADEDAIDDILDNKQLANLNMIRGAVNAMLKIYEENI